MSLRTRQYLLWLLASVLLGAPPAALRAQAANPNPEVKQFQSLEDNWSIAFVKKDQYAMELLLAPAFIDVSAAGGISTRNQLISEMFTHSSGELASMEQRAVNVRVLGDVSVVEGTYMLNYRVGAHTVDERGIFTHVYQRTRASWACVSAQRTAVFDQTDEKAKTVGKKSNAALPFHIPLIYKGAEASQSAADAGKQQLPPQP